MQSRLGERRFRPKSLPRLQLEGRRSAIFCNRGWGNGPYRPKSLPRLQLEGRRSAIFCNRGWGNGPYRPKSLPRLQLEGRRSAIFCNRGKARRRKPRSGGLGGGRAERQSRAGPAAASPRWSRCKLCRRGGDGRGRRERPRSSACPGGRPPRAPDPRASPQPLPPARRWCCR